MEENLKEEAIEILCKLPIDKWEKMDEYRYTQQLNNITIIFVPAHNNGNPYFEFEHIYLSNIFVNQYYHDWWEYTDNKRKELQKIKETEVYQTIIKNG